jgi:hyperosmotically inducible protein
MKGRSNTMKKTLMIACILSSMLFAADSRNTREARIVRETAHELGTLAYYGVFDIISYRVKDNNVTLYGKVTRPTLKTSAEQAVKGIEGVETVKNEIEVLPLSSSDDDVRLAAYRAIYGHPSMTRYAVNSVQAIHIIVKNGDVELIGDVQSELDRTLAGAQLNGVTGVHAVKNELKVTKSE